MSRAQWTIVGMVLVLIGLEVIRSQNVKTFLTISWSNFTGALNGVTQPKKGS